MTFCSIIVGTLAPLFVQLAYSIWNQFIDFCYDTISYSPFHFGQTVNTVASSSDVTVYSGTSFLNQLLDKVEPVVLGVATGILILVWVIGVLRQGGEMLADKAHPYAFISHIIRLFVCEGLIVGYMFLVETIFDLFTIATKSVVLSGHAYGLMNPNDDLSTLLGSDIVDNLPGKTIINLLTPDGGILDYLTGEFALTDLLLLDILSLIYLIVIIACALVIFMKVYGRYFRIIISIALAPIGISLFGSSHTEQNGKKYVFYLMKLGAEGLIIVMILLLFGLVSSGASSTFVPQIIKTVANGLSSNATVGVIIGFLLTQIFMCVLMMTLISASEKLADQLL